MPPIRCDPSYSPFRVWTDALYIASGKTEPFGEALEKQVEVGRAGAEFNIFPMARQTAAWKLGFKVRFPNSEADGYMMLREGVAAGQTIDLEIDFSNWKRSSRTMWLTALRPTVNRAVN